MQQDKLIRLKDVLKLIPVSKSAWWLGVKKGRYPKPVKLGPRTTCWRLSDVRKLMQEGPQERKNHGEKPYGNDVKA